MNYMDYRKKLGIGYCNEELLKAFFTKMNNTLFATMNDSRYTSVQITDSEFYRFCDNAAISIHDARFRGGYSNYENIVNFLHSVKDSFENYLFYFMDFINCQNYNTYGKYVNKEEWLRILKKNAKDVSLSFEIFEDEDGCFAFPLGAKELDDVLISDPLEWLITFPKTRKKFIEALKRYTNKDFDNTSDIADDFRKTLETFFQEFFHSDKNIENLKAEYGDYLKKHGVTKEISNNLQTMLSSYTAFMNNNAKHHDATTDNVLEYIMYQTGNIIRLLIRLRNEEQESSLMA